MSNSPLIYAIVLAWNQFSETQACLESLLHSESVNMHFVVVDNGSADGTSEQIAAKFPAVEVLRTDTNLGVARGYNIGLEYALQHSADYAMVLNNDTIMAPDMVGQLLRAMQNHPEVGMAMPKIFHYYGNPNRLWCAGIKWYSFPPRIKYIGGDVMDGPQFSNISEIEYAPSCCLLMNSAALQKVGLFDPKYYFYYDDLDLSARFWAAGYKVLFVPQAHLWHKVSVSTQKSDKPEKWWYAMGESSVRFFLRHKSPAALGGHTLWFMVREIIKLKFNRPGPFLFGVIGGLSESWNWRS